MCSPSFALWCFVLLFVVSFSESQKNSTNVDEQSNNSTVQYDPLVNSMKNDEREMESTRYNSRENSIKNNNEMQYESCINSTKNDRKNDDSMRHEPRKHNIKNHEENNQISVEPRVNSTEINASTLQKINNFTKTEGESNSTYGMPNIYDNSSIVSHEACDSVICIQFCCPFGYRLTTQGKCVPVQGNFSFAAIFDTIDDRYKNKLFLTIHDPCVLQGFEHRFLNTNEYSFFVSGSLIYVENWNFDKFISPMSYCIAILKQNVYDVIICRQIPTLFMSVCFLVFSLFLLLTFVIYSILSRFQNVHGYTLRSHVTSLIITYAIMFSTRIFESVPTSYCIPLGTVAINYIYRMSQ